MLFKKLIRDLRANLSQFITVFLMVFLGVFVFAGIHSYMDGMKAFGDKYYSDNNLPDLWIYGENFSSKDLKDIKNIDGVADAERVLTLPTVLDGFTDVDVEANFIESNNVSKMNIVKGDKFDNGEGIWLDSYLADNLGLDVGDTITLSYGKYKIKEKIVATVNTPDHIYSVKDDTALYPDHNKYGYAYLSIKSFPDAYIYDNLEKEYGVARNNISSVIPDFSISDYYVFNSVLIDVSSSSSVSYVKSEINNNIKSGVAAYDRDSNASYATYKSEIEGGNTYSGVFTVLFLFIAVLSVVTTMNRFVKKERTQVGTLKALGFKNRRIICHYVSYGFLVSLFASLLALAVGPFVLGNFFLDALSKYYEIPFVDIVISPSVFILAFSVVLIVTFVTYLSCIRILKEPASEALRISIPNVKNKKFSLTTKGIFKNASMSTKWNLRDIARNKGRAIMAIVGITGSCMLLVCAFGMLDSMNSYLDWQFNKLSKFSYKISLNNDYSVSQFEKLKKDYGDSTSESLGVEIKTSGDNKVTSLTVNDAKDHLKYTDHDLNYIDLSDDGVYVSEKLADILNISRGDNISFHIFGNSKWYNAKVIGFNRDPQNQQINCTRNFYESLGLDYRADAIYTNSDLSGVKSLDGASSIQSIDSLKNGMNSMLDTTKSMISLLIIVSCLLGVVIIYNLGVLSFSEKQYQFATLKVLGFKNRQIKNIFIKQNMWLTVIAIIIGLPLGYYLTDFIFVYSLGDNYDFSANIRLVSYLYSVIGILIVSIGVNLFLARKVNSIDMVSSLKANE